MLFYDQNTCLDSCIYMGRSLNIIIRLKKKIDKAYMW